MRVEISYDDGTMQSVVISEEAAKRCGMSFNPTKNFGVDCVRGFCAAAMQAVIDVRDMDPKFNNGKVWNEDSKRCFDTAMTQIEGGQMFAVKGIIQ